MKRKDNKKKCTGKCAKMLEITSENFYYTIIEGKQKKYTKWCSKCKVCSREEKTERDRAKGVKPANHKYQNKEELYREFDKALLKLQFRQVDTQKAVKWLKDNKEAIRGRWKKRISAELDLLR